MIQYSAATSIRFNFSQAHNWQFISQTGIMRAHSKTAGRIAVSKAKNKRPLNNFVLAVNFFFVHPLLRRQAQTLINHKEIYIT